MLRIDIPSSEYFDEAASKFRRTESYTLTLEHSLYTVALWEAKWHKPFLQGKEHSDEETLDYIRQMSMDPSTPDDVFSRLGNEQLSEIIEFINAKQTATTFREIPGQKKASSKIITSEVIYNWMVGLQIPFEAEHWHLNRLVTLIRVIDNQNAPKKKMSQSDIRAEQARLNAERRAKYNSPG